MIAGYQSGAERVDETVRAIFEAMQAQAIRFVTAPANWTDFGQQIRDPRRSAAGRQGTALDTTA